MCPRVPVDACSTVDILDCLRHVPDGANNENTGRRGFDDDSKNNENTGNWKVGIMNNENTGGGSLEEMAADQAAISERCFSLLFTMLITMITMFIIMMSIMFMMMIIIIMAQEVGGRVGSRVDLPN